MTDEDLHRALWRLILEAEGRIDRDGRRLVDVLHNRMRADGLAWTAAMEAEAAAYLERVDAALRSGIVSASSLTAAPLADAVIQRLAVQAYHDSWPDGITLSDRLWGWQQPFRAGFQRVLSAGARTGRSVSGLIYDLQREIESRGARFEITHNEVEDWATRLLEMGQHYRATGARATWDRAVGDTIAYLDTLVQNGTRHAATTAFRKIRAAIEAGNLQSAEDAVAWWMYDKQLYLLKRIARTEMAQAQHRAIIASAEDDPDVIGFLWRLSASHPEPDICDYYAGIELGLGKGVWPKDQVPPRKAHPHCMCLLIPRVNPARSAGAVNYAEFIASVSAKQRDALLPKWARDAIGRGIGIDSLIRADGFGLISLADARSRFGGAIP